MRQLTVLSVAMGTVAAIALGLTACGGGGSSGSGTTSSNSTSSSSSSSSTSTASAAANVTPAEVDAGPSGVNAVNTLYVTVTVCAPGTTTCQTIDNIQVDTGSYGLRIIGSVLTVSLPAETDAANAEPLAECAEWADGYSWGPLVTADVQVADQSGSAGESASSVPVQIIGQSSYSTVPSDCVNTAAVNNPEDTVATFGANGILGVGPFVQDCGEQCASTAVAAAYYVCATPTSCTNSEATMAQQVSNPVAYFPVDNNGVIIELPAVTSSGAPTVTGSVVFGIGTEANNTVGTATTLPADPNTGNVTTLFNGSTLAASYFDTGSNGLFFMDSSITQCTGGDTGFYCPSSTTSFSATVEGYQGTPTATVNFSVANAEDLAPSYTAFNNLGGTLPSSQTGEFDWGLPFFFGENVYVAIACGTANSGVSNCAAGAPYFAYIGN
jgi:Protein of unknown function (DUF3443)